MSQFETSKLWIAQLNPTPGNLAGNLKQIKSAIESAQKAHAQVIVFPELAVPGYSPKDVLYEQSFINECSKMDQEITQLSQNGLVIIWGNVQRNPGQGKSLHNIANCALNGKLLGQVIKSHLPNHDIFSEARYFESGSSEQALQVFETPYGKIAICICADIWTHCSFSEEEKQRIIPNIYGESIFQQNPLGVDLLVNISASPFVTHKPEKRFELLKKVAKSEKCPVIYANQVGANDDIIFDGHSSVTMPDGEQDYWTGFKTLTRVANFNVKNNFIASEMRDIQNAIVLGIQDYFHKTGFQRALVAISGGVDSALVATLACHALGPENVEGILMPGPFSSPESITDALELADNLDIQTRQRSITPMYESALALLNPGGQALGDLAEQNLQARLRSMTLMTLSNREGKLVLATSNKSEAAMGYGTLYGDMCGAIAPIGDLYKTQVYQLCEYLNQDKEFIPQSILDKAPSAELAPNQKDEDSLGPYSELDPLLKQIIEGPEKPLSAKAQAIAAQVAHQEYKRQQGPIILKISPKAFGPGRHFLVSQFIQQAQLASAK